MARVKQTARPTKPPAMNKEEASISVERFETSRKYTIECIQKIKDGLKIMNENLDAYDKPFITSIIGDVCDLCTGFLSEVFTENEPVPAAEVFKGIESTGK